MHTTKTIRITRNSTTIGTAMYRTILTSFDNSEESPGETTHAAQFSHSEQIE